MKVLLFFSCLMVITHIASASDIIIGKACYRFSDQESIAVARDIALSMAKRDALEGYAVFVIATSTVENYKLKNDIISSVSASVLRNMKIIKKSENLDKREVCRTIRAEVEEVEIRQRIVSQINIFHRKKSNFNTGLPEGKKVKILKVINKGNELIIIGLCKGIFDNYYQGHFDDYPAVRVIFYDYDGIPISMSKDSARCGNKGDVVRFRLPLPKDKNLSYSFEVAE